MSKYAEKHHTPAVCFLQSCGENATTLRCINGRPEWVCKDHSEVADRQVR